MTWKLKNQTSKRGKSPLYLIVHIMQVQLLPENTLDLLLNFLKLHRSSKHQDPSKQKKKHKTNFTNICSSCAAVLQLWAHMLVKYTHASVKADSSGYTLHISSLYWQWLSNQDFPLCSPAHIPSWTKSLTLRCAHKQEHVLWAACALVCLCPFQGAVSARPHLCMRVLQTCEHMMPAYCK